MKVRLQAERKSERRLPEVGECWRHKGDGSVYMRVEDLARQALPWASDDSFSSVGLGTGLLMCTSKRTPTPIIILRPVGGELVLEEAGDE